MALIRAGCDVTKYWHWRALRTLGVVCVEDMSISHKSIKLAIFAVFALCDYKREKRGRDAGSVIPLMDLRRRPYNPGTVPIPIRTTSRKKAAKADRRLVIMD